MVQGTTSDAGKSTLVTGLCRVLARRGVRVAPFKPQNMALNSAVTADGGEIGRAQAVQAQACGLEPHTDMNPILLKPNTDRGAQVIVQGRPLADMEALAYHGYKSVAMRAVLESYRRLAPRPRLRRRRRRRQPGRDQPARRRHRQHGLRRGGRLSGAAHRRYRPRRRVRAHRRHARAPRGERAQSRGRVRHQPLPRRQGAARSRASTGSSAGPASR